MDPYRREVGRERAAERTAEVDGLLQRLTSDAFGSSEGVAVVAQGGYGRRHLAPHSDIDLLIVVSKRRLTSDDLRPLLYPLWDARLKVGHAVVDPKGAIDRAERDPHAVTALFTLRPVAGDHALFAELQDRVARWIAKKERTVVRTILSLVDERHARAERAGWALAPNLKEDIGGLRDVQALEWLAQVALGTPALPQEVVLSEGVLLSARAALHDVAGRALDRLHIDLQPSVARGLELGEEGVDVLMSEIHAAARVIEHEGRHLRATFAEQVLGGPARSGSTRSIGRDLRLVDGALVLTAPEGDVPAALETLTAQAVTRKPLAASSVDAIRRTFTGRTIERWDERTRNSFLTLLATPSCGHALELLDHLGAWRTLLPEWSTVRARAQHDPYHRYTVDAHSFIAVEELARVIDGDPIARSAAEEAGDLDALRLATLMHDIGKGSGIDHSIAGEEIAGRACKRIDVDPATALEVTTLVRHHLLLADTATRRDIDDANVVASVAATIKDGRVLRLLYILTAADARATAPEAWTEWKAALVTRLYRLVLGALEDGTLPPRADVLGPAERLEAYEPSLVAIARDVLERMPPSYLASSVADMADEVPLVAKSASSRGVRFVIRPGTEPGHASVTVCSPDRPGALARTAGVLALHRLPVLSAQAYSSSLGVALQRFVVLAEADDARFESFRRDVEASYEGRLALDRDVDKKVREYAPKLRVEPDVRVLQDASEHSTVIEVRAADVLGLLYCVTAALADLDLDIHVAKVDTIGERVVDVFYVRAPSGDKLTDAHDDAVRSAIEHRARRLFG